MISIKDDKTLKKEFITKIKNYMINNKLVKITLKILKVMLCTFIIILFFWK